MRSMIALGLKSAMLLIVLCLFAGCGDGKINKDNLAKIKGGMPQTEVEAILGQGKEMPSPGRGLKTIMYGTDDRHITVTYKNDKVVPAAVGIGL